MFENDVLRASGTGVSMATLGLVMGFSPTIYAAEIRLLARSTRAGPPVTYLVAGVALGATVLVLVFQVFDPDSIETVLRGNVERALVERWVDLTAGALFLVAGVLVGWRRCSRPRPPRAEVPEPVGRPRRMLLLGFTSATVSASSIPTMYLTARAVRSVSDDDLVRLAAYSVFLLGLVGPFVLLAVAWERLPRVAGRVDRTYRWVVGRDLRSWLCVAMTVIGVALVVEGVRSGGPP